MIDSLSTVENELTWFDNADSLETDGSIDILSLPYLPFFSNCELGDSQMYIARLMEGHPDCSLIHADDTKPVRPYPFDLDLDPTADTCSVNGRSLCPLERNGGPSTRRYGAQVHCYYEENIFEPGLRRRWYELSADEVMFYLTKQPVSYQ